MYKSSVSQPAPLFGHSPRDHTERIMSSIPPKEKEGSIPQPAEDIVGSPVDLDEEQEPTEDEYKVLRKSVPDFPRSKRA